MWVFKKIEKDLKPGKTVYTFITDGGIYTPDSSLYNAIKKAASGKDNAFVFIEIGSTTGFGQQIEHLSKSNPSVMYYKVNDIKSIKDKLSSVLINYS